MTTQTPRTGIKRQAWREYKTTLDVQGALPETLRGTVEPPGHFTMVELGFAMTERPSIVDTMRGLTPHDIDRLGSAPEPQSPALEDQARRAERRASRGQRVTASQARRALRAMTRGAREAA